MFLSVYAMAYVIVNGICIFFNLHLLLTPYFNWGDYMNLGERIKELREKAGITQKELALRMGITPAVVGQYERGGRNPKTSMLLKFANALDVPFIDLFRYSDIPMSDEINQLAVSQYNKVHDNALFRILKRLEILPFAELNEMADMAERLEPHDIYAYLRIGYWQMMNGHAPYATNEVLIHHDWDTTPHLNRPNLPKYPI